jgi:UDP-N-acetylglucosamine 2-epimerase (hydrolysing)
MGSEIIIDQFNKIKNNPNFKIFRSLRFEYFLSLLYNSKYMIGNSSAGIKEAPYYKIPSINIGTRQNKRSKSNSIINTICNKNKIIDCIKNINLFKNKKKLLKSNYFGSGNSDKLFIKILKKKEIWNTSKQKQFQDL